MTTNAFPAFSVAGTARERGLAQGEALREKIEATLDYYLGTLFATSGLTIDTIQHRADHIGTLISQFSPAYRDELEGIAAGAGIDYWRIVALNARTEILNAEVGECTALLFQDTRILGQNWDWVEPLEDLVVLVTHERPDGHQFLTLTEPGMLAKIGINSAGIGVCLNFLVATHPPNGLPIHILTRAILDCTDLEQAREHIARAGHGKSSHLLIGDEHGGCISVEFAGSESFRLQPINGVLVHTNHCIAPGAAGKAVVIPTTQERLACANRWVTELPNHSVESMQRVLLDDSQGVNAINSLYHPTPDLGGEKVGTCATLVMDLPARTIHIKRGPGGSGDFQTYQLAQPAFAS